MRTTEEIQTELDQAYKLDLTLRIGTTEYKANRLRIGALMAEKSRATFSRELTEAEYFAEYDIPDPEQAQLERQQRRSLPLNIRLICSTVLLLSGPLAWMNQRPIRCTAHARTPVNGARVA